MTFTAADAVAFDDLPRDYTVMYQAEDRSNRIDNLRKKYQTRYYRLEARYPKAFLNMLKGKYAIIDRKENTIKIVNEGDPDLKFAKQEGSGQVIWDLNRIFSNGTYDQIQGHNIVDYQKRLFELVLDGLESEEDLELVGGKDRLKGKIPFLFEEGGIKKDTSKAMLAGKMKKGGIDLSLTKKYLLTSNNGGEIKFHLNPAMLAKLQNSLGFVPVIINIQPLKSLKEFLGLNQEPDNKFNQTALAKA